MDKTWLRLLVQLKGKAEKIMYALDNLQSAVYQDGEIVLSYYHITPTTSTKYDYQIREVHIPMSEELLHFMRFDQKDIKALKTKSNYNKEKIVTEVTF